MHLPKTGYANGEAIHVMADIENKSNADIRLVECKIDQVANYDHLFVIYFFVLRRKLLTTRIIRHVIVEN